MNRKIFLILIVLAAIGGGVWLTFKPNSTGVDTKLPFVAATETEIATLDPIKNLDPHLVRIEAQIFEGLVGLDENNQLVPRIAESWKSVDGFARWRFKIRGDVKFHPSPIFGESGTRVVTPDDVVFSFNRIMGEGSSIGWIVEGAIKRLPNPTGGDKPGPPSVKAVSDTEVEFELTSPDPFFPARLSSTPLVIMPSELASLPEGEFGVNATVGTGPFMVKSRSD